MQGQELLQRAMLFKEKSEEIERQLDFCHQQIIELDTFNLTLKELDKNKEAEMLAPLGKGIYSKVLRQKNEKLFVEVGAGVIVRKTPSETVKIINEQMQKFNEARIQLTAQLASYQQEFSVMLQEVQKLKSQVIK